LREQHKLTQSQLATALHAGSKTTVASWEAGYRSPDIDMIITIATHFGVSVDYLMGRTDKKEVNR
jgi:transcriptional regulator with XRE-family HTH domain